MIRAIERWFVRSPIQAYLLLAFISLIFTVLAITLNHVINNDGIVYVRQAEKFHLLEWNAALNIYKWPTYSLLIAVASLITGLPELLAAYLLNALFTAGLCIVFVKLVGQLGGNSRTMLLAAFVISAVLRRQPLSCVCHSRSRLPVFLSGRHVDVSALPRNPDDFPLAALWPCPDFCGGFPHRRFLFLSPPFPCFRLTRIYTAVSINSCFFCSCFLSASPCIFSIAGGYLTIKPVNRRVC